MTDEDDIPDDLEDRIRTHADRHPDATAAGVVGAFDALDPTDLDAVRSVLDAGEDGFNQQDGDAARDMLVNDAEPITEPNRNDPVDAVGKLSDSKSRKTNTADGDGADVSGEPNRDLDNRDNKTSRRICSSTDAGEDVDADTPAETAENPALEGAFPDVTPWVDAEFSRPESGIYPPDVDRLEKWMGAAGETGKQAFAPWADRDHPDADPDEDARWKWGLESNHADGATVAEWVDMHPEITGRAFIQTDADPFGFVDGDDVRCPESGEVHPAFRAILEHLGLTYADVSTSGAGVHAWYRGELPIDGKGQATFDIDTEPWGENDTPPTVEIYANKHLNITHGDHVPNTPLEVREWDADVLETILRANGYDDEDTVAHDTDRDRADLDDYEPDATGRNETTTDMRDVLKAVDRLEPSDVHLSTRQTGTDSTGWSTWDPSYRSSESGESLHYNGEGAFHDHKEGEAFGVLGLLAAEERIISDPWDDLEGSDWWAAVDAAREHGAAIPDHVAPSPSKADPEDVEHTAVLPPAVRDLSTTSSGWDWEHAAESSPALSLQDARDRTKSTIADAYQYGDRVLVEAQPTLGKSYGAVAAAADTDTPITVLTGRGRKEQYDQFEEWADEHGLESKVLPSFTDECPTAAGDHGEDWKHTVMEWYNRGATGQEIHNRAEDALGRPLPCQVAEDGEHIECPYRHAWSFDPDEKDVLLGHYTHAHVEQVTHGRAVVFDEFPGGAYETTLSGEGLETAVSYWLRSTDAVPFDSYHDLVENRDDDTRRADALLYLENHVDGPAERDVFDDDDAHAAAPLAVWSILAGEDLENGYEYADLGDLGTGLFVHDPDAPNDPSTVVLLQPPDLPPSADVVALDGTPTLRMWELALGCHLNHRPVLQDAERVEYIRDTLNLQFVRTTAHVKPYNNGDHVNTDADAALLEAITDLHDERPGVVSTMTALDEYADADVLEYDPDDGIVTNGPADRVKWYGNVLGSNEFKEKRVGAVVGSNNYSDQYVKKWAAFDGRAVDTPDRSKAENRGKGLSYGGGFGDDVLQHMREHDTLQAAMRFGRDGNGAVVYVHTDTLPEWVDPDDEDEDGAVAAEGRVITTWSDGMRDVVDAVEDLGTATTAAIVDHPAVDLSERQVFDHLEALRDRGVLDRRQDPEDGRRFVWADDGVHRLNDHGEVELPAEDLEDLDDDEVAELARSSIYTCEFRKTDAEDVENDPPTPEPTPSTATAGVNGGDRPPNDAD